MSLNILIPRESLQRGGAPVAYNLPYSSLYDESVSKRLTTSHLPLSFSLPFLLSSFLFLLGVSNSNQVEKIKKIQAKRHQERRKKGGGFMGRLGKRSYSSSLTHISNYKYLIYILKPFLYLGAELAYRSSVILL